MIENSLSRRNFLTGAGIVTGAAVVAAGTGLIKPKAAEAAPAGFPWDYPAAGLQVNDITGSPLVKGVKHLGYDYYISQGGCMIGTGKALIQSLIDAFSGGVGDPYATQRAKWESFPVDLFKYGGGGVNSWGTICGALHGATYVIRALFKIDDTSGAPINTDGNHIIDDLYQWYCGFNFPSTDHDTYDPFPGQTRTICNSPLCHASVSTWCHAHTPAKKVTDSDRGKRCAKVAGDVAGKAAELLNAYFVTSSYSYAFTQPDTSCSGCHVTGGTEKWVQMKSNCTSTCHAPGKNTTPIVGSACTRT